MYQITDYLTEDGRDPFKEWLANLAKLANLADRQARARVLVRLQRMAAGNFGDCKPLMDGGWKLCIDHGAGYRVYYSRVGSELVLLLIGGDKRKQQADIDTAVTYLKDWNRRSTP